MPASAGIFFSEEVQMNNAVFRVRRREERRVEKLWSALYREYTVAIIKENVAGLVAGDDIHQTVWIERDCIRFCGKFGNVELKARIEHVQLEALYRFRNMNAYELQGLCTSCKPWLDRNALREYLQEEINDWKGEASVEQLIALQNMVSGLIKSASHSPRRASDSAIVHEDIQEMVYVIRGIDMGERMTSLIEYGVAADAASEAYARPRKEVINARACILFITDVLTRSA